MTNTPIQVVHRMPFKEVRNFGTAYEHEVYRIILFCDDGIVRWSCTTASTCDDPGCYDCSIRYAESAE